MKAWAAAALGALWLAGGEAEALQEPTSTLEAAVLPAESSVSPAEQPVGGAVVRLDAARGAHEPALVVVRASRDGLFTARATALYSRDGAVLPASAVELDRVQWVAHAGTRVADRLDPIAGPTPITSDENLLLWVEVAVPHGAAPGYYHGELQLGSGAAARNLPIELRVLPFSLPATPSLATSFTLGEQSGPVGAFARLALREGVTYRLASPPPFKVTPLEGTLQVDFSAFDRDLEPLLEGASRPSSIAIEVPSSVPMPRRLEYLLAVKRHLAERGLAELLVNFGEEGSLLPRVQGAADVPGVALVSATDDAPRRGPFWWRLGGGAGVHHAVGALDSDASMRLDESTEWLQLGTPGSRIRSIGWAAFRAGAVGLYTHEPAALLYEAEDGSPRASVRLKLLHQAVQDYEYLQLASKLDPARARHLAEQVAGEGAPSTRTVDFGLARGELTHIIQVRRPVRTVRVP